MTVETVFEHHPWELAWVVVYSTEEHLVSYASEVIVMNYMMLSVQTLQALKKLQPPRGVTPEDATLHTRATAQHQDGHQPR